MVLLFLQRRVCFCFGEFQERTNLSHAAFVMVCWLSDREPCSAGVWSESQGPGCSQQAQTQRCAISADVALSAAQHAQQPPHTTYTAWSNDVTQCKIYHPMHHIQHPSQQNNDPGQHSRDPVQQKQQHPEHHMMYMHHMQCWALQTIHHCWYAVTKHMPF